ncbi:ferric reductase-like transmembrane domain-containing protein [Patescibacteria group bacterium]|nr:ferric reductase-like transmembrane domain-containing protein [Patescibacteria group bacterium]
MKKAKYFDAWVIALVVSFLPVIIWIFAPSFTPRLGDLNIVLKSVGQIVALIGVAMFAVNLILSARLKIFDDYFGGLNKLYEKHNLLGQIALILLLAHPLLLIPTYASSYAGAASFLLPSDDWEKTLGILALATMIGLIVITLYLRPKYNIWKWTHKFLGGAFFLGALHMFFIPSDVSRFLPLKIYMLVLSASAIVAFVYRSLLSNILIKKYKYKIITVKQLNKHATEIVMAPKNEILKFSAGQFVFVSFNDTAVSKESHPFSISSSSSDNNLAIIVKNLGDYTKQVAKLSIGSDVEIEGPFGSFSCDKAKNKKQIWIAGGIGITPFISMAASLPRNQGYDIHLFYSVKSADEAILPKGLTESDINIVLHETDKKGYAQVSILEQITDGFKDTDVFICAPPMMIAAFKKQLEAKGIDKSLIHSEEFDF